MTAAEGQRSKAAFAGSHVRTFESSENCGVKGERGKVKGKTKARNNHGPVFMVFHLTFSV
jgi:hypothetical protein